MAMFTQALPNPSLPRDPSEQLSERMGMVVGGCVLVILVLLIAKKLKGRQK